MEALYIDWCSVDRKPTIDKEEAHILYTIMVHPSFTSPLPA